MKLRMVLMAMCLMIGVSSSWASLTFLADYNNGLDAGYAAGSGAATVVGSNQYLTADGRGVYASSTPNKAMENVTDSYYGQAAFTYYQTAGNLDRSGGSLIMWAQRTGPATHGSTMTTLFAASNAHIGNTGQKLVIYTAGGSSCKNTYALFNDGSGNKILKNNDYYNQMKAGDWTFFGVTWDYNEGTGALDVSLYCRDKKYPVNRSVTSMSIAGWNNNAASPDKMFVGTDYNAAFSGGNRIDQLGIYSEVLSTADFDDLYASTSELVPEPATLVLLAVSSVAVCRRRRG